MSRIVYLDNAAATPLDPKVISLIQHISEQNYFNPSATYSLALESKRLLNEARAKIAYHLGSKPTEIVFTAGGTEANNLAIKGLMSQFPEMNVLYSAIEHDSIINPAKHYLSKEIKVDKSGLIDFNDLLSKIDDQTVLISIIYASNEIGTVQDIASLSRELDKVRYERHSREVNTPLYLHIDACQATNYLDLHVSRLGVDMMTINASKIYGPKQTGALYVSSKVRISAIIDGGGQERNLRSGTENLANICGFSLALDIASELRKSELNRLSELKDYFTKSVSDIFPQAIFNGHQKHSLANNIHLTLPGKDNESLIFRLDQKGIMVAAGSACSASNDEPSHVLKAIGISDDLARNSLRITMGRQTTKEDVDYTLDAIRSLLN